MASEGKLGRLQGKVAVITGAAQGIGKATALKFAQEGARVIATDMNLDTLSALKDVPGIERLEKLDVTKKEDIEKLAASLERVDVIFNCAGIVPGGSVLQADDATWSLTMDINVRGAFWLCQALIPIALKNGNKCSIVNMASVASSLKAVENRFIYCISKGALIALTKSIAADFVSKGIRANNICPGTVETPSWQDRVNTSPDPEKARRDFIARQKMGRLGTAEEIAHLAVYLASDESDYVTGQDFIIDGGWSM